MGSNMISPDLKVLNLVLLHVRVVEKGGWCLWSTFENEGNQE